MSDKWKRRQRKYDKKRKMIMRGKGMKTTENAREMEAAVYCRQIIVGVTRFYCGSAVLVVHSPSKGDKFWGAQDENAYPIARFTGDYIRKNMVVVDK